jgi:capsular polysaccharide transport system permease protein
LGQTASPIRRARLGKIALAIALFLISVFSLFAAVYYAFIASDQFVTETRFTVRASQTPTIDANSGSDSSPSGLILQDTQIVMSYLASRAIVEALDRDIGLHRLYSTDAIDYFSRLPLDAKIEKFVDYWKSMIEVSAQLGSGIVTLSVRSFSADDGVRIVKACIELSETMVNQLNSSLLTDSLAVSLSVYKRAEARLIASRDALEKVRNSESITNPDQSSASLTELISTARAQLLALQQDYEARSLYVGKNTPQIRALQARIEAAKNAIEELTAQQTASGQNSSATKTLSNSFSKLELAKLEYQDAEKQYASSLSRLENVRLASESKSMYLEVFLQPAPAQQPRYPHRTLYVALFILLTAILDVTALFVLRSMRRF